MGLVEAIIELAKSNGKLAALRAARVAGPASADLDERLLIRQATLPDAYVITSYGGNVPVTTVIARAMIKDFVDALRRGDYRRMEAINSLTGEPVNSDVFKRLLSLNPTVEVVLHGGENALNIARILYRFMQVDRETPKEAAVPKSPANVARGESVIDAKPVPIGRKPGTSSPKREMCDVAIGMLENPETRPKPGRGRLTTLSRAINLAYTHYQQNSVTKNIRAAVKAWQEKNPGL